MNITAARVALVAVPALILAGGTVYLVQLAGQEPSPPPTTATTAAPSGTATTDGPPRPKRNTVTVGGVRLDNTIPTSNTCAYFRVPADVTTPVRVEAVTLAGAPEFVVLDDTPCQPFLSEVSTPCRGATLTPGGAWCYAGVGVARGGPWREGSGPGSERHTVTIQLQLRATCTSRTGQPCAALGERYSPSPADPIDVVWTDPGRSDRIVDVQRSGRTPDTSPPVTPATGPPTSSSAGPATSAPPSPGAGASGP